MSTEKSLFNALNEDVRKEVEALIHAARFGSLATFNLEDGYPMISRILVATDYDGAPVTLISTLAGHTRALLSDSRCSLMLGEPGKGDPLASPRIMITCDSRQVDRNSEKNADLRDRFIRIHPKSKNYIDFGDFSFFKLNISYATYNGGFGRAFRLKREDLQDDDSLLVSNKNSENEFNKFISENYNEEIHRYFSFLHKGVRKNWKIRALDNRGIDFDVDNTYQRLSFSVNIRSIEDIKSQITALIINMF